MQESFFLNTEDAMDAFLRENPELADVGNLLRTVTEDADVRRRTKLAVCLAELQRAHYVDLQWADPRCGLQFDDCRLLFDAFEQTCEAFVCGSVGSDECARRFFTLLGVVRGLRRGDPRVVEKYNTAVDVLAAIRTGKLRGMHRGDFARRLVRRSVRPPPHTNNDQNIHTHTNDAVSAPSR